MGRIMGIDLGKRWVGVSISDPTGTIARGLCLIDTKKVDLLSELRRIIEKYGVEEIVIGLPMDTRGGLSDYGKEVKSIGGIVQKELSVKVSFWNEVYTTKEAERLVGKRKKEKVDIIASEIILQSYLDSKK